MTTARKLSVAAVGNWLATGQLPQLPVGNWIFWQLDFRNFHQEINVLGGRLSCRLATAWHLVGNCNSRIYSMTYGSCQLPTQCPLKGKEHPRKMGALSPGPVPRAELTPQRPFRNRPGVGAGRKFITSSR
jgi:hypothetical protein